MKNILITGGSKGIGEQMVREFAKRGHRVFFTYLSSAESSNELVKSLHDEGYETVEAFRCDMGKESDVAGLFRLQRDKLKDIDILINNAAIRDATLLGKMRPFLMTSADGWWEVVHNNVNSVLNSCRCVLPSMLRRKDGRIINITSLAGIKGNAGQSAYSASKAAISAFSRSLAKEIGQFGVTVNCVAPGFVRTGRTDEMPEQYFTDRVSRSLLKRMGTVEEIANLVCYLALDAPAFLVDQEIVIDGGNG